MKQLLLFVLLTTVAIQSNHALAQISNGEISAIKTVNLYFDALKSGDTNVAQQYLGGKLLNQFNLYLNDQEYKNQLSNKYTNASLTLSAEDHIGITFVLKKNASTDNQFLIHSESD